MYVYKLLSSVVFQLELACVWSSGVIYSLVVQYVISERYVPFQLHSEYTLSTSACPHAMYLLC